MRFVFHYGNSFHLTRLTYRKFLFLQFNSIVDNGWTRSCHTLWRSSEPFPIAFVLIHYFHLKQIGFLVRRTAARIVAHFKCVSVMCTAIDRKKLLLFIIVEMKTEWVWCTRCMYNVHSGMTLQFALASTYPSSTVHQMQVFDWNQLNSNIMRLNTEKFVHSVELTQPIYLVRIKSFLSFFHIVASNARIWVRTVQCNGE